MAFLSVLGDKPAAPGDAWRPTALTLAASGLVALLISWVSYSHSLSRVEGLLWAAAWVIVQFAAAVLLARAATLLYKRGAGENTYRVRLGFAAIWFAPIAILIVRHSWWLVLAVSGLAVAVAALRGSQDREPGNRFFEAAVLQAALVTAMAGHLATAAFLTAIPCYKIARSVSGELSPRKLVASTLAAILLTATGLVTLSRSQPTAAVDQHNAVSRGQSRDEPNLFSGVVLTPERPPHVVVVAPPSRRKSYGRGMRNPIVIPFSGEYWIYYWPLSRPPKSSLVEHGTPLDFKFTADLRLRMEAHQNINTPISADCCSSIDLEIVNSDPMPGTVSVQLLLGNSLLESTTTTKVPRQSLGVLETGATGHLRFEMPAQSVLREFDQLIVIYVLHQPRAHRSANISVSSFSLILR